MLEFASTVNNTTIYKPEFFGLVLDVVVEYEKFNLLKERNFIFVGISCLALSTGGPLSTRGFMM